MRLLFSRTASLILMPVGNIFDPTHPHEAITRVVSSSSLMRTSLQSRSLALVKTGAVLRSRARARQAARRSDSGGRPGLAQRPAKPVQLPAAQLLVVQ